MFGFIYEEGKTKDTKAKYVLIDKIEELFLQFYIGYNEETKEYFTNSYVPNKEKDPNLSRDALKIIRTEIYNETPSGKVKIETIEHEKIRELIQLLKENLKIYSMNEINSYLTSPKYFQNHHVEGFIIQIKDPERELFNEMKDNTFRLRKNIVRAYQQMCENINAII